ncbi:hypothetical protein D7223_14500 [Micromonospora endolithica]|uniref:Uncharacterized protein n=1 Tax=Micromonospora endolithica TaxID=230091 RepID=A0A3A9ZCU3_9ACTN|nr:hypothetical protein D7223_14500 [Micromonospora endolithica]
MMPADTETVNSCKINNKFIGLITDHRLDDRGPQHHHIRATQQTGNPQHDGRIISEPSDLQQRDLALAMTVNRCIATPRNAQPSITQRGPGQQSPQA